MRKTSAILLALILPAEFWWFFLAAGLIGCTTFVISFAGAMLGGRIPGIGGKHAGILGGLVLIGIGVKLLIEGVFLK